MVAEDNDDEEWDALITVRGAEDFERAEFEAGGGLLAADGAFGRVVADEVGRSESSAGDVRDSLAETGTVAGREGTC